MKTIVKAAFFAVILATCGTGAAMAQGPKPWVLGWSDEHWDLLNLEKPYMEPGKAPHNSQWDNADWVPQDWLGKYAHELDLIRGFYQAGIISDQYVKRSWWGLGDEIIPVLEVGPAFFRLGGQDKRRVTDTFDTVYGITGSKMFGMFVLVDSANGKQVGTYTQYGLAIQ